MTPTGKLPATRTAKRPPTACPTICGGFLRPGVRKHLASVVEGLIERAECHLLVKRRTVAHDEGIRLLQRIVVLQSATGVRVDLCSTARRLERGSSTRSRRLQAFVRRALVSITPPPGAVENASIPSGNPPQDRYSLTVNPRCRPSHRL